MCGICGSTDARDASVVQAMNERMIHRGPDDEGTFVDSAAQVGLGARRLSIIDVAGGHQPLANEDGTIWAVLNGEIYNFATLRERLLAQGHVFATRTDTEVLVHLYEERGGELVHDLEGMYAFAIWDARRRTLWLVRDRFGEKPLFYAEVGGVLTFASELNALLAGIGGGRGLDPEALDAYFVYGYVPGSACIDEGVHQLEPGRSLVWDAGSRSSTVSTYWRPPVHARATDVGIDRLVEQTAELLEQSVVSRMVADVPVGVFLSGGVDSTLITALTARHAADQLSAFTVDYDLGYVGEASPARLAAAAVGAVHRELVLTSATVRDSVPSMLAGLDQPIADPAIVPLRALSEFARAEVKVAIGGEGADELFGGYPRYRWLARGERLSHVVPARGAAFAAAQLARAPRLGRARRLSHVLSPESTFNRHLDWVTSGRASLRNELYGPRLRAVLAEAGATRPSPEVTVEGPDVAGSLMRLDQTHWLPDDVLAKADRASMGASLELRTPFLNRDLSEFAASVPSQVHLRGGGKFLLRKVLRQVLPAVGEGRRKVAFRTPRAEWLRGPLAPELARQLDESPLYHDGWFERATVAAWVDQHARRDTDLSSMLWPVFVLGCWFTGRAA